MAGNSLQEELPDSLFRRFLLGNAELGKCSFSGRFESALNRQRVHLDQDTTRSMRAVYFGMLLMTVDVWERNGIQDARLFVLDDNIILLTDSEHVIRGADGKRNTIRSSRIFNFNVRKSSIRSFPEHVIARWKLFLPPDVVDKAMKSVYSVWWYKPDHGSSYVAYGQDGETKRYVSSSKSPLLVSTGVFPYTSQTDRQSDRFSEIRLQKNRFPAFPANDVADGTTSSLTEYLKTRAKYLREVLVENQALKNYIGDRTDIYRVFMAGVLNFELLAQVQVVPRFSYGAIQDLTFMQKNLDGKFIRYNTPLVFTMYERSLMLHNDKSIPAEIQTKVSQYRKMTLKSDYIFNLNPWLTSVDKAFDISVDLRKKVGSWFTALRESYSRKRRVRNVFDDHLNQFLTYYDANMLEHHLLGQLGALQGAERHAMNTYSELLASGNAHVFSGLAIYDEKIAVMINVANRDAFVDADNIGLDTLFLEKHYRPLLLRKNVKNLIVCNVDLSPRHESRYKYRTSDDWTIRSSGALYTHESNHFDGIIFTRSRRIDRDSDWADTHPWDITRRSDAIATNFAGDPFRGFNGDTIDFVTSVMKEVNKRGTTSVDTTNRQVMAVLDGLMSSTYCVHYPDTQAEQSRSPVMFIRPVNEPMAETMWYHLFADEIPHEFRAQILPGDITEARRYHLE